MCEDAILLAAAGKLFRQIQDGKIRESIIIIFEACNGLGEILEETVRENRYYVLMEADCPC